MNLARGFRPKASVGSKYKKAHQGDAAESCRRTLLTPRDAEMAEQVVSDVIVQECVLNCGGPWRGCGIPAEDLCLLAMQGAARPTALNLATPGAPSPPGIATSAVIPCPDPADLQAPGRPLRSVSLTAGTTLLAAYRGPGIGLAAREQLGSAADDIGGQPGERVIVVA
jgi:hypothetical protein